LLFKVGIDGVLGLMSSQGGPQDQQLPVGLEPPEALGGLHHSGSGPAQRNLGILPAFDVAADLPNGRELRDVGIEREGLARQFRMIVAIASGSEGGLFLPKLGDFSLGCEKSLISRAAFMSTTPLRRKRSSA